MSRSPIRSTRRRVVLTVLGLATAAAAMTATVTACGEDVSDEAARTAVAGLGFAAVDPFYDAPDPVPPGDPGELLRSERMRAPDGTRAWRVLYHSRRPDGTDIAVSGMVIAPADSAPLGVSRRIVTFGHGTTGVNDRCAPSRSDPPFAGLGGLGGTLDLVRNGYVVAVTDYAGLGTPGQHPIYVAVDAGRAMLDAARAARQILDAQAGTDVVAWGYSQGGQAAMAAGGIAASYAPELNVKGVVASAPLADLPQSLADLQDNPDGVAYLLLAATGLAATDPNVDLEGILTPAGRRLALVADRNCVSALTQASQGESTATVFTVDPLATEPFSAGFARQRAAVVGPMPPVLMLQGDLDMVIHQSTTDGVVESLCDAGTAVDYRRYPTADHASILTASMGDLQTWIGQRFEDVPARNACTAPSSRLRR